jgi:hypothetical protein
MQGNVPEAKQNPSELGDYSFEDKVGVVKILASW